MRMRYRLILSHLVHEVVSNACAGATGPNLGLFQKE